MNDIDRPEDAGPDPELGAALRRAFDPEDSAAFVARVLARLPVPVAGAPFWGTLAAWARVGIPAALAVAALVAILIATRTGSTATLEDALVGERGGITAVFLAESEPPDPGVLVSTPDAP